MSTQLPSSVKQTRLLSARSNCVLFFILASFASIQISQGLATSQARLSQETSWFLTPLLHPGILLARREEAARGFNHRIKDSTFTWVSAHFGGPL